MFSAEVVVKKKGKEIFSFTDKDLEGVEESAVDLNDKYSYEFTGKHDHGPLERIDCKDIDLNKLSQFLKVGKDHLNTEMLKLQEIEKQLHITTSRTLA
eukprot:maker-scaffold_6-snap-gene-18.35-mRNA-1 protein AED:0.00 eAED:0.00 QI:469/1/1/1/0.33/0.25/4/557/97